MTSSTAASARTLVSATPRARLGRPPLRLLLLLPAMIYLVTMTQAPFVLTLWYSLHKWILTSPELGQPWVGLENFTYTVFQDPTFRDAIVNTLVITVGIVGSVAGAGSSLGSASAPALPAAWAGALAC